MIYHLSLQVAGVVTGVLLILLSAAAVFIPTSSRSFVAELPRSRTAGIILLAIDLVWTFGCWRQ
jgi:hypothetical protein